MIRWLGLAAAVLGLIVGITFPREASGNLTGAQLAVVVQPSTLSDGSSPLLTCGWHTACTSPPSPGIGLDWDDNNQNTGNPWYFRCFCYVSDTNRTAFTMYPLDYQSGPTKCDIMTVWVVDIHSGALMAVLSLPHFSGHLDCGDVLAQKGVQDGYPIPSRVPAAGGGVSAAA